MIYFVCIKRAKQASEVQNMASHKPIARQESTVLCLALKDLLTQWHVLHGIAGSNLEKSFVKQSTLTGPFGKFKLNPL